VVIRERVRAWLESGAPAPPPPPPGRMSVTNTDEAAADADGHGPLDQAELRRMQGALRRHGRLDMADTLRLVNGYEPRMSLEYHGGPGEGPLQAAKVRERRKNDPSWHAPFMFNPRQSLDYYLIDTISTMTVMQSLISTKMRMIMGTGFKPKLYLKKPEADGKTGDEEVAAKERDDARLAKLAWITDVMEAVDRRVGLSDGKVLKVSVFSVFSSLIRGTIVYNRGAAIKVPGEPLEVDGHEYEGLPGSLQYVHPKDLGHVQLDAEENMTGVVSNWHGLIEVPDMIYLWNSYSGEERPRTKFYGLSMIDGCMATGRQMFRYQTETVPVMIKSSYTGAALVMYRAPGVDDQARAEECRRLASMIKPGTLSVVSADNTEVEVHPIDIQPRLGDVVAHNTEQIKEMCMHAEIPYSVVFDESASNRATLTGKLKYTKDVIVGPFRKWLDAEITPQWYGAMLKVICESREKEELLEEVGVELEWEDLPLDADEDLISGMREIDQAVPIQKPEFLRSVGRADLIPHMDVDRIRRQEEMEEQALEGGDDMPPPGGGDGAMSGMGAMRVEDEEGRRFKVR